MMETSNHSENLEAYSYCSSILYLIDSPLHQTIIYTVNGKFFKKNTYEKELYDYSLVLLYKALNELKEKYNKTLLQVHIDLKNVTMKNIDYAFIKKFLHTFQSLEYDTLDKLIITNIPIFFKLCYKVLKPFVDKDVKKKIFFEKKKKNKVEFVNRDEELYDEED